MTDITAIARAAEAGGADALSLINTCLGMAVDWRRRRPVLGNVLGGLSGPAIKPIALRIVYQVAQAVKIPLVGIGGIATIDDVMEFLVDRRHGRADRHGELLQSHRLDRRSSTPCPPPWPNSAPRRWPKWWERWKMNDEGCSDSTRSS